MYLMLGVGSDLILEDTVFVDDALEIDAHLDATQLTQEDAFHYNI